ncbi:MAG: hypothetical protein Q8K72_07875 [Acidimicrobiales bacterium]|nr:hypothetical protein [Acidimicrobiales bacterium]
MSRLKVKRSSIIVLVAFFLGAAILTKAEVVPLLVATVGMGLTLKVGFAMLGGLARPIPEPPPAGELRKVKIMFRCSLCGTEVRMTTANDEMPEPPRHCLEDMDLVAPIDDL